MRRIHGHAPIRRVTRCWKNAADSRMSRFGDDIMMRFLLCRRGGPDRPCAGGNGCQGFENVRKGQYEWQVEVDGSGTSKAAIIAFLRSFRVLG